MVTNPGKETLQKRRNRAHGKICQGNYGICPGFRDFINEYLLNGFVSHHLQPAGAASNRPLASENAAETSTR